MEGWSRFVGGIVMRFKNGINLVTIVLFPALCAAADAPTKLGDAFVEHLSHGRFSDAEKTFDKTMKAALPAEKLKLLWRDLEGKLGDFKSTGTARFEKAGGYTTVFVPCNFTKATLDAKIVYDKSDRVAGLFFVPHQAAAPWTPPAYGSKDRIREVEVTFGENPWILPGALTLPTTKGPHPAVVLVHGSGPHDRDETIGPNKPFKDLAWGLANAGVAVLRYEKRTHKYTGKIRHADPNYTLDDEVIDDAAAALVFLGSRKEIDGKRLFVLGHSLGGMVVPRIALKATVLKGGVVMAGNTRSLDEMVFEQLTYIAKLDGKIDDEEQKQIAAAKDFQKVATDPKLKADAVLNLLGSKIPGAYWLDLRAYKPAEEAKKVKTPLLILQGQRDYQVTLKDFGEWKAALAGRKNVTFKLYADLNHLFIAGKGPSGPTEYERPGHVAQNVVSDVAAWIARID